MTANERAAMGGEVVPFERPGQPTVEREEYEAAIRTWCCDRNLSDALKPEEIGALRRDDRIDAQRKAILLALSHYYRNHERADVAPGVAVVVAFLSDNEKGLATISQPTLAKFFGRSRSAIGDAQKRLKDDGLIGMTRGRYAGSYPIIPRDVTRQYNHMTWLIEAINTQDGAFNLPAPPADCQSTGPTGGLNQTTDRTGGLKSVNQPVEPTSINRPDATQLQYLTSKKEKGEEGSPGSFTIAAAALATTFAASLPAAAAPPPQVEHVLAMPAECWQTPKAQMAAATNTDEARAQKHIWRSPFGAVEVSNAFRDELTKAFPLVDVASALAAASPNVRPDGGAVNCMAQVRRQFGYMQQDALEKARRAASRSGSVSKPPSDKLSEKPSDLPQIVWDKILADREAARAERARWNAEMASKC